MMTLTAEEKRLAHNATAQRYRDRNRDKINADMIVRVDRNRKYVVGIKTSSPCSDCDNFFPAVCMDFDHREGEEKIYGSTGGVGRLVRGGTSLELIDKEIAKCDLVCACCHRIRTATRGEWSEELLAVIE